jgi:predicted MFS family arabinose efflux permease
MKFAAGGSRMKPGSWGSIWLVYFYSILCAASISKLIPIERDLEHTFHTSAAGVGFAISIISLLSILAATVGGNIIDRVGARRAIIVTTVVLVVVNVLSYFAPSMFWLDCTRLLEGVEFIGIVVAAPALIMATTTGRRRVQAMSLWSTYTPAGFAIGLLFGVPFAGTPSWRYTFLVHGGLFAGALLLAPLLPETPRAAKAVAPALKRARLADFLEIYRELGPWKLSISNAVLVSIGLGTSTVIPAYFARVHHLSVARSAGILALANLAMIFGGIAAGFLLARGVRPISVYVAITLAGVASGLFLYAPFTSIPVAIVMLFIWQPTTGAAVAVLMSLLPQVTRDPTRGGAAMGLVGQVMAVTNLMTPPLYLGLLGKGNWLYFVALIFSGWILSLAFLPAWKQRPLAAAPASSLHEDPAISVTH